MRQGGGAAKGHEFERYVCKVLSRFVTLGAREDVFWRSAMSGGRATVARSKGRAATAVAGDICSTHSAGEPFLDLFFVECKFVKDLALKPFLLGRETGLMWQYWCRVCEEAESYDRIPLIIFKENGSEVWFATTELGYFLISEWAWPGHDEGTPPVLKLRDQGIYLGLFGSEFEQFDRPKRRRIEEEDDAIIDGVAVNVDEIVLVRTKPDRRGTTYTVNDYMMPPTPRRRVE